MKIEITLTKAELIGIRSYLAEVDEPTTNQAVELEVKTRLYHALRDQREAIADHITEAENKVLNSNA